MHENRMMQIFNVAVEFSAVAIRESNLLTRVEIFMSVILFKNFVSICFISMVF